jgi:hypothetical protein
MDLSKQRSEDHSVDLQRRTVIRHQKKKYKFQANKPFDLVKNSVQFCNVSFPHLTQLELIRAEYRDSKHILESDVR